MKASYHWLKALLPGLDLSPSALAERFTRAGVAVDAVSEYGAGTADIVVAAVVKIEPHPKREKLRLVTVDRGGGVEQRVVCGAPNVPDPGGLVCFAPLGTTLPAAGMTLTPRDIGGVVSEGMLCSETELGLTGGGKGAAADHEGDHGILILPAGTATPGTPLRVALPAVHDFILDIDVTANRPDCLGHVGLAREASALLGRAFAPQAPEAPKRVTHDAIGKHVTVTIEDTERCPHYGAAMVVDVTVGPSPLWLRYRLESLGIRAISSIVDITNLILLEFGHPMHAFDLDLVRGGTIVVRRATEGEPLKTLDGVAHTLVSDDLVIADAEGPVALAGVMGGAGSEIRATTKRVLLECAYFTTRGVRRSARRHGIHSESSHRFERGVDPADIPDVLAHAASLLTALSGGSAIPGTILAGVPIAASAPIVLREARLNALVGVTIPFAEAKKILADLGFEVTPGATAHEASVGTPTHRPDIAGEADLIEEIVRVRSLDSVPNKLPAIRPQAPRSTLVLENLIRRAAVEVGLSEAITYGFTSPKELAALGLPPATRIIANPMTEDRSVMRTSLLPGLLEALRRARRHGVSDVRLFTTAARFLETSPPGVLPDEVPSFAAVIAGHRHPVLQKPIEVDIYDAKGAIVAIVERVTHGVAVVAHQPAERRAPYLHPRGAGDVHVGGVLVGSFGPLHPDVVEALDLDGGCLILELDLRALEQAGLATPKYRPIPMLPAATRDIALVVSDDVEAGTVGAAVREVAGDLCESVELFDLFRGAGIAEAHRSLAFHVVYRDPKAATDPEHAKTLTDEEVDKRHAAVVAAVKELFGAVLRA
jgi:phenylalanyl-tRNA synthetase beta chain